MKPVLAIAATDPTAGAGLFADLKTFSAFGVYGYGVVTAVTVQSRIGVASTHAVAADVVTDQIRAALGDIVPSAVKIGMLAASETVLAVARSLAAVEIPIVLDPVLASSGGSPLLDAAGIEAIRERLLRRCAVLTPNLAEAGVLAGLRVEDRPSMLAAAERLGALGARAVLVKGGHLPGDPADLLWEAGRARWLEGTRIEADLHGTGCALSSAIAASLALGRDLADAVGAARAYVRELLASGSAVAGPGRALADHAAPLRARVLHGDPERG